MFSGDLTTQTHGFLITIYAQRRESLRLSTACGKVDIQRLQCDVVFGRSTYIVIAIDGPGAALCPAIASAIVSAGNKVRVSQSHPKVGFLRLYVHHRRRLLHVDHLRWLLQRVTLAIALPPVSRSLEAAARMRRISVKVKSQNTISGRKRNLV